MQKLTIVLNLRNSTLTTGYVLKAEVSVDTVSSRPRNKSPIDKIKPTIGPLKA